VDSAIGEYYPFSCSLENTIQTGKTTACMQSQASMWHSLGERVAYIQKVANALTR
jgi:hypothetical protein